MDIVGHLLPVGHAGNREVNSLPTESTPAGPIGLVQLGEDDAAHAARLETTNHGAQFAPPVAATAPGAAPPRRGLEQMSLRLQGRGNPSVLQYR